MFRGDTKPQHVTIRMNIADRREHEGGQNNESKAAEYVGPVASMQYASDESIKLSCRQCRRQLMFGSCFGVSLAQAPCNSNSGNLQQKKAQRYERAR